MPEPIEQINEIEQESPKQENKRQTKNSLQSLDQLEAENPFGAASADEDKDSVRVSDKNSSSVALSDCQFDNESA